HDRPSFSTAAEVPSRNTVAHAATPRRTRRSRAPRTRRRQRSGGRSTMNVRAGLRREVGHGGRIPPGWRMAWYEPRRRVGVYYPPPLHWLFRGVRELLHRARVAVRSPEIECLQIFEMQRRYRDRERLADEYARGYLAGWRECFQTCLTAVEEELGRS